MNELLLEFNAAGIRYLLIGGQAMRLAGMPRFSILGFLHSAARPGEFHPVERTLGKGIGRAPGFAGAKG